MQEWQPIETAPDNLSDVLLWNGKCVFLGWKSGEGWRDSTNQDRDDHPEDPQPTHWMPLPKPPLTWDRLKAETDEWLTLPNTQKEGT